MAAAFGAECNDKDESGCVSVLKAAEVEHLLSPRKGSPTAENYVNDDDHTIAALGTADKSCIPEHLQLVSDAHDGLPFEDLGICSGGYFLEDTENPECDYEGARSLNYPQAGSEPERSVVENNAQLSANTERRSGCRIQDIPQQLVDPSEAGELTELLDDDLYAASNRDLAPLEAETANKSRQPNGPVDCSAFSSLLGGTLGIGARRRTTEASSWCSQHQAASQFCLKGQLLREEAEAGRLRVRQQPNPHGESFKPMRLYALEEVEQLAIRVWGSLEAARAEKERRIENRWQRKKRSSLRPSPPTKRPNTEIQSASQTLRRAAVEQPVRRAKEDEWEEV